ncbi:conserved membrane hypothetical protein [Candidatus Sulfopaludibacter sp. SbA3]|nr:conserved membrane hypothetical protein [Candidatus Sulfopaludibacter sp. SbA3]
MREWLRDTHGPNFELLRHFVRRFFESELTTSPDQWKASSIGLFSLMLPWFPVFAQPLKFKYAHFSSLPTPGPYQMAVRADELWLLTLMMSAIGLVTALKWQSLFPSLRDYQVLGPLPLRPRQIFQAKFFALLIVSTAVIVVLNLFPALDFPMLSASRWQINPSMADHLKAMAIAVAAACYFFLFGLLALQGVLLNLLPPRSFGRVTGYLQGLLVAVMLILLVLSFSIDTRYLATALRPQISAWLPPVWFLGLQQHLLGDPDPVMSALAGRAQMALLVSIALAVVCYTVSYQRHRKLMVEGSTGSSSGDRKWTGVLLDWLVPNPRQQAILVFVTKTLARSSQHRTILMGYGGFGVAILISGILGMQEAVAKPNRTAACFVYAHVILLTFLLIGMRHLFTIPVELKANWTFQITERQGRLDWMHAVDRFMLFWGAVLMLAIPLPFEIKLLGWRAAAETILFAAFALLCYEWIFTDWQKLPFTCSHLPGKIPAWILTLWGIGILGSIPLVNGLFVISLYQPIAYIVILAVLVAIWLGLYSTRRAGLGDLRLMYDDLPDPAIHGLNLMR